MSVSAIRTHLSIDRRLCGSASEVGDQRAAVDFELTPEMAADERGLVHGGFVFGAADYAAMLAVNHEHVVLAQAEVKFLAPVVVGERLRATAHVSARDGKRASVKVEVTRGRDLVFEGVFHTVTPSGHVLDRVRR